MKMMVWKMVYTTWKVDGATAMYWFTMAPYESPPFWEWLAIYFHRSVMKTVSTSTRPLRINSLGFRYRKRGTTSPSVGIIGSVTRKGTNGQPSRARPWRGVDHMIRCPDAKFSVLLIYWYRPWDWFIYLHFIYHI